MSEECREDIEWLVIGFESLVESCLKDGISVIPADINSDIIENFFCAQRGITGGSRSNPSVYNYMYGINSVVLGASALSSKSNAGLSGLAAQPYSYTTPVTIRRKPTKQKLVYLESPTKSSQCTTGKEGVEEEIEGLIPYDSLEDFMSNFDCPDYD